MPLIQYVAAALGSAVVISIASLVWPKVTAQPRPKQLTQVREMVMQTQVGQNMAQVLGVTDEASVKPMSVGEFVQEQATAVVSNVADSAQHAVTSQVLVQLAKKFNELPKEEQDQFRALICSQPTPVPTSGE
ncbi:hypothetical protein KBC80_00595 [Candidatus Woesebacteria bacterium]|jgi:hypothetical protein|nr:hypothetical protein [Candidatus Woesebacteria bacterium]